MAEKKNYPVEFGNIYENTNKQTGEKFLSIGVFRDVVLKKGMRVKMEKPQAKFDRILNSPNCSDEFKEKTRQDMAKTPENVKMVLSVDLEQEIKGK